MPIAYLSVIVVLVAALAYQRIQLRKVRRRTGVLLQKNRELQEARNHLLTHAYFDHLTGLANRTLLEDRFQLAVERAKRSQLQFALVMIDLNNFKQINDTHGHLAGDHILIQVSQRLQKAVRASDTVARFGGDEFVLIVEALENRHELGAIGAKLVDTLGERIVLGPDQESVSISASIGFSIYPDDGAALNDLLDVADRAMYECKSSGLMPLF